VYESRTNTTWHLPRMERLFDPAKITKTVSGDRVISLRYEPFDDYGSPVAYPFKGKIRDGKHIVSCWWTIRGRTCHEDPSVTCGDDLEMPDWWGLGAVVSDYEWVWFRGE